MTKAMRQSFGPREAKGWNPREGEKPKTKGQRDLYTFAVRARQQGRHGLARDLASLAEVLPIIEGRCKLNANLALHGRGAAPLDGAHSGNGDGMSSEVRAAVAIRDMAQRLWDLFEDWCA